MKILSPAKINLFLHILRKRPDGYHDLVTLMCCVGLYDIVSFDFGAEGISVACTHAMVPEDHSNLAFQAANCFLKRIDKAAGVAISIDKHIPVGAGLGGGSSNAAAVMLGLNRYYGHPLSTDELVALGLSIGADVPFFIYQKPAVVTGVGGKLELYKGLKPLTVLLVYPGFGVSTAEMYKIINLRLTKCGKKFNNLSFKNQRFDIANHLCNDFETVAESKYPEIAVIKDALLKHGAKGALMSGSGSAVFGLFFDSEKARKAFRVLSQHRRWQLFLAKVIV
jgi:4-diphosphocytidyl-2-C-methyl-D-erythritol kinase